MAASLSSPVLEICDKPADRVADLVVRAANRAIQAHGAFSIAIAGGSLVNMLGAMAELPGVQWAKWHVAWVDERCVRHGHSDSNFGAAHAAWLSKVPIPSDQIYAIDEGLCQEGGGGGEAVATKAAEEYEERLRGIPEANLPRSLAGLPAFDLLLLGFGPDGHICSLFPGHPLLADTSGRWVLPIGDSPKPPSERITFSMPVVNAASEVALVGTGSGKAEVVKSAFSGECDLPVVKALGSVPHLRPPVWVLDPAAAALLPEELAAAAAARGSAIPA